MVPPLRRFSGGVYRVPAPSVRRPARPPGTATGEMNPVQGMSWRPNPVSIRCMTWKARSPKRFEPPGGRPHGDGGPVVVRGRESRPHGEAGQVGGWSAREVRDMRDAETTLAISRGCRTVSWSKALNGTMCSHHPGMNRRTLITGLREPPIEPTGEPDDAKVSSPVRRGAAETGP